MFEYQPKHLALLGACVILILAGIGYASRKGAGSPAVTFVAAGAASSDPLRASSLPTPVAARSRVASAPSAPAATNPPASASTTVHVAGAVKNPGVYTLPAGKRIVDAVHLAGGPARDADLDALNMAARMIDGEQILVPRKGHASVRATPGRRDSGVPFAATGTGRAGMAVGGHAARANSGRSAKSPPHAVAINTATADDLDSLPGVGPATAQKIVDYRAEHGPFAQPEDILNVKGIGPRKLEKMRPYLIVP